MVRRTTAAAAAAIDAATLDSARGGMGGGAAVGHGGGGGSGADDDRDVEAGGLLLGGDPGSGGGGRGAVSLLAGLVVAVRDALADAVRALLDACLRGGGPLSGGADGSRGGGAVTINDRAFAVGRRLGEGGYSFVHLATDRHSKKQFALKRMLCQTAEQAQAARREVEAHAALAPLCPAHIAPLVDYAFVRRTQQHDDANGAPSEEALLLLPYYPGGSLQDALAARHAATAAAAASSGGGRRGGGASLAPSSGSPPTFFSEAEALRLGAGIADALAAMHAAAPQPLAHRDVCPRNVMLGGPDGRTPVLIDLGSVAPGRVALPTRTDALRLAETASAHSSMPYRAPELWDPPSGAGAAVTEATDGA
jgi:serine/threonine protein kinase